MCTREKKFKWTPRNRKVSQKLSYITKSQECFPLNILVIEFDCYGGLYKISTFNYI